MISIPSFDGNHFWLSFGDWIPRWMSSVVQDTCLLSPAYLRIEACRLLNYRSIQCHLFVPQVGVTRPWNQSHLKWINETLIKNATLLWTAVREEGWSVLIWICFQTTWCIRTIKISASPSLIALRVSAAAPVLGFWISLRFWRHSEARLFILARCHVWENRVSLSVCLESQSKVKSAQKDKWGDPVDFSRTGCCSALHCGLVDTYRVLNFSSDRSLPLQVKCKKINTLYTIVGGTENSSFAERRYIGHYYVFCLFVWDCCLFWIVIA